MARFFISHAASKGSAAETMLREMCKRLTDQRHDAFANMMIMVGDEWLPRLYDELCRCDVGIVLLDRRALGSSWVKREVHYLLWRHYLRSVRILVVLLDGLTVAELDEGELGELAGIQMVQAGREPDLEAVLDRTLSVIGPAKVVPDDRLRRWLDTLHAIIRPLHHHNMLGYFALDIGIAKEDLDKVLDHERTWFVVHQLIGRPKPMQTLNAILGSRPVLGDKAKDLAHSALPALVDAEAARHLLRRVATEPGQPAPVFVLNAAREVTPWLYVLRAVCGATRVGFCRVSSAGGVNLVTELKRRCETQLLRMLSIREPDRRDALKSLAGYRYRPLHDRVVDFAYLVIDAAHGRMTAVAEVIRQLRDEHPWLTMIVTTGPEVPADTAAWGLGNIIVLEPLLKPADDNELDEVIGNLRDNIDRSLLR